MIDSRQPIRWAKIERIGTPTVDPERFEYRPDRGWRWLQRAAFKLLGLIGAHSTPVVTTFVRAPQENDELLKSLLGQEGEWIELVHDDLHRPRIYIGPDEYPELLRLLNHRDFMPTTVEGRIQTNRGKYGKWHDIPITVVPWMVGAVIVPD